MSPSATTATQGGTPAPSLPTPGPTDGLPAITIDEPPLGAVVDVPFGISGTADVFEAALSVQVLTDAGVLVCQHNLTATSGSGTRGDWSTSMAFPPPAPPAGQEAVPMTVRAFDYSAEDGSEENVVSVNVNVSGIRPPIVIDEPGCDASVAAGRSISVSGTARVFEGALQLELLDSSGTSVVSQTVQAESGVGEAPWSTTITVPPSAFPGTYRLVAFSYSPMGGSRENDFAIPLDVAPP